MYAAQHAAPLRRDALASHWQIPATVKTVLLWCVVVAGCVSAVAGVVHAVPRSQDFQWSGERLLLHHIDPWRDYLLGDPAHGLIATQVPNYLPILYVLLAPFGLLSAAHANLFWALCNLAFAVASSVVAARFYGFNSWCGTLAVTAAMLAAAPTRITIGNGQQGLLVLALWSFALLRTAATTRSRAALVGVSYLKYSFAPALALLLLVRDGVKRGAGIVLWSLLPCAAATVAVWLWITRGRDPHHLLALVTEPLAVTRVGYQPTGDPLQTFMDLFECLMGGGPVGTPRLTLISLITAMSVTAVILVLALRKNFPKHAQGEIDRTGWLVALMATMSFVLYKHHPYDEVVYLFPLCYALRHLRRPAAMAALFLIAYIWYVQPSVDLRITFSIPWCVARILIPLSLLLCVYRIAEPAMPEPDPA